MFKEKGVIWILSLVLIISLVFMACGKTEDTGKNNTNEEESNSEQENSEEPKPDDELEGDGSGLPDADLEGYVFTVADNAESRWFPEADSSDLANAIIERIKWVEEKYNCKIEVRNHSEDEFSTAVMAGDKYADIIVTPTWELGRHIKAKRLVNMNEIPNLNMKAEYWNQFDSTSYLSYKDKTYGTSAPFIRHPL